jgi:hypothetical protein
MFCMLRDPGEVGRFMALCGPVGVLRNSDDAGSRDVGFCHILFGKPPFSLHCSVLDGSYREAAPRQCWVNYRNLEYQWNDAVMTCSRTMKSKWH